MRVSIESALQGGLSDCRNRRLQTMFQLVGFGDLAGSGVPKIYTRWASQHWVQPLLQEDVEHELTTLELRMVSPDKAPKPPAWRPETTGVKVPNHRSKSSKPPEYPAQTPGVTPPNHRSSTETTGVKDETSPKSSGNASEMVISPSKGPYLDWEAVPDSQQSRLLALAAPVAQKKKVARSLLQTVILALCDGHFLGLQVLSSLLQRDPDDLRKRILSPMIKAGLLRPAYPAINAPRQAYTRSSPDLPPQENEAP